MTTTTLIDSSAASATSDVIQPPRSRDEKGLWQSNIAVTGGGATLGLQGRTAPAAPWHVIVSETFSDMGTNATNVESVDIFPEMRAVLTGNNTSVAVKGWLAD